MNYYMVTDGDTVIGVGTTHDLRKYQAKHKVLLTSDEAGAQYIQVNNVLYRDTWFAKVATDTVGYTEATITRTDEDTYNELVTALESGDDVTIDTYEDYTEETTTTDEETGEETVTQTKLSDRVAALEEQLEAAQEENEILSEAVMELAEIISGMEE